MASGDSGAASRRRLRGVMLGSAAIALGGVSLATNARAQEEEQKPDAAPDADFLEYLGSWQGEDDEWWVIAEWEKDIPGNDDEARDDDRPERDQERNEDDEGT